MTDPAPSGCRESTSTVQFTVEWLVVLLAASLPLYRPWVGLASAAVMVLWLAAPGLKTRLAELRRHRLTWAILAFIGFNLLSLTWSDDPGEGLHYLAKYRYLLLVPMIASIVPPARRRLAAAAFVASALLSVALSFAVSLGLLRLGAAHPGNPSPTMAHLDYTLVLAVAALTALAAALYESAGARRRLMWAGAAVLLASGLAVNIGRAGQLGFAAGLAALLAHWSWRRSKAALALTAAGLAAATAALIAIAPPAVDRFAEGIAELRSATVLGHYESNIGGRVAALAVTGRILREHPLLGTGVGANMAELRHLLDTEFRELKPAIYWYRHFHNQYAQVTTEIGLVGLLLLAWIFWELIRGPYSSAALAGCALALAAVYLAGFVGEPYFRKQIPLVTFALFCGLITASRTNRFTARST